MFYVSVWGFGALLKDTWAVPRRGPGSSPYEQNTSQVLARQPPPLRLKCYRHLLSVLLFRAA